MELNYESSIISKLRNILSANLLRLMYDTVVCIFLNLVNIDPIIFLHEKKEYFLSIAANGGELFKVRQHPNGDTD